MLQMLNSNVINTAIPYAIYKFFHQNKTNSKPWKQAIKTVWCTVLATKALSSRPGRPPEATSTDNEPQLSTIPVYKYFYSHGIHINNI